MYKEDVVKVIKNIKNLEELKQKTIFISGAAGQIGKTLVSLFLHLNDSEAFDIKLILNVRNESRIKSTFLDIKERKDVSFYIGDIINEFSLNEKIDFIVSAASNTHPKAYAEFPIETILTNVLGAKNLFELGINKKARVLNLSTVEIYGDMTEEIPAKEKYMGYLDCNTVRACYNESKRLVETMLQAYITERNLNALTVRLPRLFGPETKKDDSKALTQFLNNAISKENIVLKSDGNQFFSYLYTPDAVSGMISAMINGKTGEAYNFAAPDFDIRLRDLAEKIAEIAGVKVVFDLPDEIEKKGFSKSQYAILDSTKARREFNWKNEFDFTLAISHTLKEMSR